MKFGTLQQFIGD